MQSLTLIRPVLIKIKVTENYKKVLAVELQEAIRRVELDLRRLDFQEKRLLAELEKKNPQGIPAARQELDQERRRRLESRQKLIDRLKEVGQLALGSEVISGKMESSVEVEVGDNWGRVIGMEIILQDGVVSDIRQGSGSSER
jgi:hypothetical protein